MDELADAGVDGAAVTCGTSGECPAATPVCDPVAGACRTCRADSECDGACHELTGACVQESAVLYVSPTGTDNTSCSKAAPCGTVLAAVSQISSGRSFVRVADGAYVDGWNVRGRPGVTAVVISGTDLAPDGANFMPGGGVDLETEGNVSLVLEGVTIADAAKSGLIVRGPTTVSRVVISGAQSFGIDVRPAGNLRLADSEIRGSVGPAIQGSGLVEIQRSRVIGNPGGGVIATGGYTIVNTILANNGAPLARLGGAVLAPVAGRPAVFRFNTVTRNNGGTAVGVDCTSPATLDSSIIVGNGSGLFPELSSVCAPTYSLLATLSDGHNIAGDPMFVNPMSDYHVLPASPAVDAADPAATETVDVDGGKRPTGAARDIGADEQP